MDFNDRYLDFLKSQLSFFPKIASIKLGVDCSNGMASLFARSIFPKAQIINDRLDGTFPCHSPNPLNAEARKEISALVRERGLDCGIIFDGDADRAMVVDERGEFVQPDYLIPVVAEATRLIAGPSFDNVILHDVRTSRGSIEVLQERGFKPQMVQVGHAFAKPVMRAKNALCGGELAGHYYFGEFFGCDSGILAAIRILGAFSQFDGSFSQMMSPIVSRYHNSGELNFKVGDKDAAIVRALDAAKAFSPEIARSEMDGIRVEYADGWFNIRKSNTEPYLRLIVEHRSAGMMQEWVNVLRQAICS